ncbi:DNA polymerase III subunit beta [Breznakiellaceae bacterium SP9]
MKFTCERSVVLKEIAIAQEIIATKNAISVLSNIYLETDTDHLIIKATDLKVNFETRVPVSVVDAGTSTVLGDKFLGILNSIPDGEIEFEQTDQKAIIRPAEKKIKFELKSTASEKFPDFSLEDSKNVFQIPIKTFKDMVGNTIFAISDDETRYFMNGVFFEKLENKLNMVATDGRRLAFISKELTEEIAPFAGVIIPPKMLTILMRRSGDEGMLSISVSEKTVSVQFGPYRLSSALIEGQFPNYSRVIPESQEYSFTINRLDMLNALKRVALLVEQKSHRVYLDLSNDNLSVYSAENDIGNAKEDIPCKYEGEAVSIALNYRYIEEPFKVMTDEEVMIRFTEATKAITILPVPEKDFFHIVMPMQLD